MSDAGSKGAQAQRLMDDPVLTEAFATVVNEAIAEWARSPADATELRESLHRLIIAVDRVRGKLRSFLDDAKMAERAEQAKERVRNLGG